MRWVWLSVVVICLGTPAVAKAGIVITEVAWMGSAASANHEWIELHNPDSLAVPVDGWTLSDGANLLITLSGTIAAGQYIVLERSSDDTVNGAAFLIYTGALVNTGATLTLRRDDGQIEDRVEGGTNWQSIGGDNVTKHTAQYNGTAWQTAAPTPGSEVGGSSAVVPTEPVTTSSTSNPVTTTVTTGTSQTGVTLATKSRSATVPLKKTDAALQLTISSQDVMYVHQPVTFSALGAGVGRTIAASLDYRWNLGDLTMATGSKVTHRFDYPGTYVIVVQARFGKHDVLARKDVTVLPVTLSLAKTESGQVLIQNNAVYDVDVSGYRVESAGMVTIFPPLSYVAAKQAVPVPVTEESAVVILKDPQRRTVARLGTAPETPAVKSVADIASNAVVTRSVPAPAAFVGTDVELATTDVDSYVGELLESAESVPLLPTASVATTTVSGVMTSATRNTTRWPYGVAALVVAGMLVVVWWPRPVVTRSGSGGG